VVRQVDSLLLVDLVNRHDVVSWPSPLLLDYRYGAAAMIWWGSHSNDDLQRLVKVFWEQLSSKMPNTQPGGVPDVRGAGHGMDGPDPVDRDAIEKTFHIAGRSETQCEHDSITGKRLWWSNLKTVSSNLAPEVIRQRRSAGTSVSAV
jgi:hypothetical protein